MIPGASGTQEHCCRNFCTRSCERDETLRENAWDEAPWDGVAEVRPFGAMEKNCRRSCLLLEHHTYLVYAWKPTAISMKQEG